MERRRTTERNFRKKNKKNILGNRRFKKPLWLYSKLRFLSYKVVAVFQRTDKITFF